MTPNGAAANLAIGGAAPVASLSGKLAALASTRPALSFKSPGRLSVNAAFSDSGVGKVSALTSVAVSSLSNTGASALADPGDAGDAGVSRTFAAHSRGTGAEKPSRIGRIGKHGALARSRS